MLSSLIFSTVGGIIMWPQKTWELRLSELTALTKVSWLISSGAKTSDQCAEPDVFPSIAPIPFIMSLCLPFSPGTYDSVKIGHL